VDQRSAHLSSAPGKFDGLALALVKHTAGVVEGPRFVEVRRLFAELSPQVQLGGVGEEGALEFVLPSGMRVPLQRLAFSERNAFVLAAAPVLMGLSRSLILLDTPEIGLAPGVAARWLGALTAAMPEAQWIVATRDPALVARVEPSARIELHPEAT